ncbi:hypothetical protein ACFQWB_02845 [Paenibacillus thermoaerophilus]|uniref:DUF2993 domain-containing protein n=1 Tax=Paenibacillus thermoaerophilus TaxID=1215385 RepID=A0ABW2V223_9BACL|nr:hypothetical protein [Paenibacillus thermoaerophilus]TMV17744.1 hypothetical protein FE781_06350 [Paenibacillus thermoaerophilus]
MRARRILFGLIAGLFALAALACALLIYVRPDKELTLDYKPFKPRANLLQGLLTGNPELVLTESDIRSLVMAQLSANRRPRPGVEIVGADLRLDGDRVSADLNLRYRERADIGARLTFRLIWRDGVLTVRHEETNIKSLSVPASWFRVPDYSLPLAELLPAPIVIRDLQFRGKEIVLTLGLDR